MEQAAPELALLAENGRVGKRNAPEMGQSSSESTSLEMSVSPASSFDTIDENNFSNAEKIRYFANVRERERIRAINDHYDEIRALLKSKTPPHLKNCSCKRTGRKSRRKKLSKLDTLSVVTCCLQEMRRELAEKNAKVRELKNQLNVHFEDDHLDRPQRNRKPKVCMCLSLPRPASQPGQYYIAGDALASPLAIYSPSQFMPVHPLALPQQPPAQFYPSQAVSHTSNAIFADSDLESRIKLSPKLEEPVIASLSDIATPTEGDLLMATSTPTQSNDGVSVGNAGIKEEQNSLSMSDARPSSNSHAPQHFQVMTDVPPFGQRKLPPVATFLPQNLDASSRAGCLPGLPSQRHIIAAQLQAVQNTTTPVASSFIM